MTQVKSCFLIADEVGLGKTKSAKAILYEMIRTKKTHDIHCIYMASSEALAKQNMAAEFLNAGEEEEADVVEIGTQQQNYEGLAIFQKKNAEQALRILWDRDYQYTEQTASARPDTEGNLSEGELCKIKSKEFTGRLSSFHPMMCAENKSYMMQLSPQTSFFNPKQSIGGKYIGNEKERKALQCEFEKLLRTLNECGQDEKMIVECMSQSAFYRELYEATKYEIVRNESWKNREVSSVIRELLDKLEKISATPGEADWWDCDSFHVLRRIRSNAAGALYRPELIILDEFQRYPEVLEGPEDSTRGYPLLELLSYLKKRFENQEGYVQPRILLLSATPYNFDKNKMKPILWGYSSNQKNYEVSAEESERPYDSWETLAKKMSELGSADEKKDGKECVFVRTEKSGLMQKAKVQFEHDIDTSWSHQFRYLNPLLRFCGENCLHENDLKQVCQHAYETPEFWRFNYGYTKVGVVTKGGKETLLKHTIPGYSPYDNLGMRTLLCHVFGKEGSRIPRLWVPPVCEEKIGTGKTLVFTAMQVTTRSVAYFCDCFARELIREYTKYDYELVDKKELEKLSHIIVKVVHRVERNEAEKSVLHTTDVLYDFFSREFVRRVIAAQEKENGWKCKTYTEAVLRYCEEFKFKEMIEEYAAVLRQRKKCSLSVILSAFMHRAPSIIENVDANSRRYYNAEYTEMFVCDDNKQGQNRKKNENDGEEAGKIEALNREEHRTVKDLLHISEQFNSPVYPMVLVARSSAQEGFNLQFYGDKLMHWQNAANVSAFLQREGRLNRPGSLIFRHKIWQWLKQRKLQSPMPNGYHENLWKYVQENKVIQKEHENAYKLGLFPLWCLESPKGIEKEIRIEQILPIYEYNDSLEEFAQELIAAQMYTAVFR